MLTIYRAMTIMAMAANATPTDERVIPDAELLFGAEVLEGFGVPLGESVLLEPEPPPVLEETDEDWLAVPLAEVVDLVSRVS